MAITKAEFYALLHDHENENLEFKEAKNRYDFDELTKYCCAIANERGGLMVLGVTDSVPHGVVGTSVFRPVSKHLPALYARLHIKIEAQELSIDGKRVLIFIIPSRAPGTTVEFKGARWMRTGEGLAPMSDDQLRRIFDEMRPDFSSEICPQATLADLDHVAIEEFRKQWSASTRSNLPGTLTVAELLQDTELLIDNNLTYASLVLFGTQKALGRLLGQAEIIYEFRQTEATGPADKRKEYREGFFSIYRDLWGMIDSRNDIQHFREGLFIRDIPTFMESIIREAVLNAASHRDYRETGAVFIRQYPRKIEVISPGGFPPGVTQENILWTQNPRNRRICEVFAKCGLVERAGQGANLMFEESIRQSKPLPDYSESDVHRVYLTIKGQVQDRLFLIFLEKIGQETLKNFSTKHFLVLDYVRRELPVPDLYHDQLRELQDLGAIERIGSGPGSRYFLCRKYYDLAGKGGVYTRNVGLDRRTNKALLLKHIQSCDRKGARLSELKQVIPQKSGKAVQKMLFEMKKEGIIYLTGITRASRWHPVTGKDEAEKDTAKAVKGTK